MYLLVLLCIIFRHLGAGEGVSVNSLPKRTGLHVLPALILHNANSIGADVVKTLKSTLWDSPLSPLSPHYQAKTREENGEEEKGEEEEEEEEEDEEDEDATATSVRAAINASAEIVRVAQLSIDNSANENGTFCTMR